MSKKALIIIIIILSVLLFGIVIFGVLKNTNAFSAPEGTFKKEYLIYEKRNAIADFDKYSKYVLGRSTEQELSFKSEEKNFYGKAYIDSNMKLHFKNENSGEDKIVSDINFIDLYVKTYEYGNGSFVFAISEDKELYSFNITSAELDNKMVKFDIDYKAENFVNIEFILVEYPSKWTVFVQTDDGRIVDAFSDIPYDEYIREIYNDVYVLKDRSLSTPFGETFKDSNSNNYKIKGAFKVLDGKGFIPDKSIVILTEDNKLIYITSELDKLYEYSLKVENITGDTYDTFVEINLEISFENGYKVNLVGETSSFYPIIEK